MKHLKEKFTNLNYLKFCGASNIDENQFRNAAKKFTEFLDDVEGLCFGILKHYQKKMYGIILVDDFGKNQINTFLDK